MVASPIEACGRLRNAAKGAVVVVRRGGCDYFAKAQAIVDAQGIAMLVANNASELLFPKPLTPGTGDQLAFPGLPASIIREAYGNWIVGNSSSGSLTFARELVRGIGMGRCLVATTCLRCGCATRGGPLGASSVPPCQGY